MYLQEASSPDAQQSRLSHRTSEGIVCLNNATSGYALTKVKKKPDLSRAVYMHSEYQRSQWDFGRLPRKDRIYAEIKHSIAGYALTPSLPDTVYSAVGFDTSNQQY